MNTLQFKCTLLSDIIVNQKAATEGPNKTLDYIPGSNFLGIVASILYDKITPNESLLLFHSGKVRFGDAHPANDKTRTLRVPAAMFNPKMNDKECYVHHCIPTDEDTRQKMREKQLKQQRNGFYDFSACPAAKIETKTTFAIKSAYDKVKRKSEDEKMYGYESLRKGMEMYFSVEFDADINADLVNKVKEALTSEAGKRRVGRSRTSQYGLIKIVECEYNEVSSTANNVIIDNEQYVVIYADSRLIFIDEETGIPSYQPSAKQLGVDGGEIAWEKSQIRTFQYAPWNYRRQCFDSDRCGLEKGSVILVKTSGTPQISTSYVGSYQNEGFGRVIYNPVFLQADEHGVAKYGIAKAERTSDNKRVTNSKNLIGEGGLLKFVGQQYEIEQESAYIYKKVNEWTKSNKGAFQGQQFASQWGAIRSLAMQYKDWQVLKTKLFGDKDAYLCHGIAENKWKDKNRLDLFMSFCNDKEIKDMRKAIINLAAEMAKAIRREEDM